MRITKAMLEIQIKEYEEYMRDLRRNNDLLRQKLAFFEKYSMPAQSSALIVACERVTDATAHVLSDLMRMRREKRDDIRLNK